MNEISLYIPNAVYNDIKEYLIPKEIKHEQVAFIFAKVFLDKDSLEFKYHDWYPVLPEEYESASLYHVELIDEIRPHIIKIAHDSQTAIIEFHSHPFEGNARFSWSDFSGFEDFVPHIRWRLGKKPYAAIVISRIDFDGIVWINELDKPVQLTNLLVGKRITKPNGLSLKWRDNDESISF